MKVFKNVSKFLSKIQRSLLSGFPTDIDLFTSAFTFRSTPPHTDHLKNALRDCADHHTIGGVRFIIRLFSFFFAAPNRIQATSCHDRDLRVSAPRKISVSSRPLFRSARAFSSLFFFRFCWLARTLFVLFFSMTFIDWLVLIAIVYFLFKVLVDWATSSGAAAAAVNNQQQQQNLHQQPGPSGVGGGGSSHQQNFLLKPRNNRTPGEGTCYEIGES